MVVFDLICCNAHRFELWVPSAEALDRQIAAEWVNCPHCGTASVQRLPATPAIHTRTADYDAPALPAAPDTPKVQRNTRDTQALTAQWLSRLWEKLHQLKQTAEDVGARFPDEARRIHHGDAPPRPIKGRATAEEAVSLLEEGIIVMPLPPDKEEMH